MEKEFRYWFYVERKVLVLVYVYFLSCFWNYEFWRFDGVMIGFLDVFGDLGFEKIIEEIFVFFFRVIFGVLRFYIFFLLSNL